MLDVEVLVELRQAFVNELSPIVCDDSVWYVVSVNDVFPDETFDLFGHDVCEQLSCNPLGEIVDCDQEEFNLPFFGFERSYDVHSPLGEWPG